MSSDLPSLQAEFPRPRHAILVVEDEILLRMAVADELRRHGFAVFEAPDAENACRLLQREAIDLLFSDVQLPGIMDGLALAKLVRTAHPETKVIIASGHVQADSHPGIADACFRKPYDFVGIVAAIRKLLADRGPPPALAKRRKFTRRVARRVARRVTRQAGLEGRGRRLNRRPFS
jgi:DNA-binding response OmpR family regulator